MIRHLFHPKPLINHHILWLFHTSTLKNQNRT